MHGGSSGLPSTPENTYSPSASAWSTPFVLVAAWGFLQLWLKKSAAEGLAHDIIMVLLYASVIVSSMLPTINRSIHQRQQYSGGSPVEIIEETLGCIFSVLVVSVVLALVLLTQRDYFRDPLHLALQLAGVALMANGCVLVTVLLSVGNKLWTVIGSLAAGSALLALELIYQPSAGLSYHALAWLSAIAVALLLQARALTVSLPRPRKMGYSMVLGKSTSLELSVAGTSTTVALWLSLPSSHASLRSLQPFLALETSLSLSYLVLVPTAMLAWIPLERQFKEAMSAFEQSAQKGGNLDTLDYQKKNLISQSLLGMQRVHLALIAAVIALLACQHIFAHHWPSLSGPTWLLPLTLMHVALQMIALCAMRLLFYLQRDRELLLIGLQTLALVVLAASIGKLQGNALLSSFALVLSSACMCLLAVWLLRHRLDRWDYLYFMGGRDANATAQD